MISALTNFYRKIRIGLTALFIAAGTLFAVEESMDALIASPIPEARTHINIGLADAALGFGFPEIAQNLLADALKSPALTRGELEAALLIQASCELAQNRFADARKTLAGINENSPQKNLREGLALLGDGKFSEAELKLSTVEPNTLPQKDLAWFYLARGVLLSKNADFSDARAAFEKATARAVSELQREQFAYVRAWNALVLNIPADTDLNALRERCKKNAGTAEGADCAKLLVVALARAGKRDEALKVLNETVPIPQVLRAEFDILNGLLQASPTSATARAAFKQAIRQNPPRDLQIIAMAGLWQGVNCAMLDGKKEEAILAANDIEDFFRVGENSVEASGTPAKIEPFANVPAKSPNADLEFFTRARIAHAVGNEKVAVKLANNLLADFPASPLVADTLRLLIGISVGAQEYRRAATLFEKLREKSVDEGEKARISILIADCHFLSGDYKLAADIYSKIDLAFVSQNLKGALFFQQILSEIKSGRVLDAEKLFDERKAAEALLGWEMRTECVVIESLRDAGEREAALVRCKKFLADKKIATDFRIRVLWLQAILHLETNRQKLAIEDTNQIISIVATLPQDASATLHKAVPELTSRALLLKARALNRIGDEAATKETLDVLRGRFPETHSAMISYIEEGRFFSATNKPAQALACFEKMIERYGDNPAAATYAPIAYFEAAQEAATLGHPQDAIRFLDAVAKKYPSSPLVFYARMRQADFFRVLNDFDSALVVYEGLITAFPAHLDLRRVEICRADCLLALASIASQNDTIPRVTVQSAYEKAVAAYERLYNLPGISPELMAEVGYKWGYATAQVQTGTLGVSDAEKKRAGANARKIYWRAVSDVFAKATATGGDPTATWGTSAGYWLARSLFAIAESYEEDGDFDGARRAYTQIINWGGRNWIPGMQYAQTRMNAIIGK